jgi:hypothetical protein
MQAAISKANVDKVDKYVAVIEVRINQLPPPGDS